MKLSPTRDAIFLLQKGEGHGMQEATVGRKRIF
jgi:hypothetical protein